MNVNVVFCLEQDRNIIVIPHALITISNLKTEKWVNKRLDTILQTTLRRLADSKVHCIAKDFIDACLQYSQNYTVQIQQILSAGDKT